VAEPEPAPEPEAEVAVEVEVDDEPDTELDVVDDLPDELADVDLSGIDIPDPDAVQGGGEIPKRAPARRKPPVTRKPGAPPSKAVVPDAEEE
jgi:hypothetical protein